MKWPRRGGHDCRLESFSNNLLMYLLGAVINTKWKRQIVCDFTFYNALIKSYTVFGMFCRE